MMTDISHETERNIDNLESNKIKKFKNLEGKNESRFQNFQIRMKIKKKLITIY